MAFGATACCALLLGSTAQAENNVRLTLDNSAGIPGSGGLAGGARTMTLQLDDTNDAENEEVWRRGWGGGWGWRGGWGWGGYAPVTTFYYAPRVYYSTPLYYYYPSYSWCPITLDDANAGYNVTLNMEPRGAANVTPPATTTPPTGSANGTYPYNGGPANPVPMPHGAQQPQQQPAPATQPAPRKTVPLEGIPISLPGRTPVAQKYTYPAYGETSGRTQFAEDRPIVIRR